MHVRTVTVLFCLAALALSACGRKGDLLSPYEAQVEAQREAEKAGEPAPAAPEPPVQDKRFILDGLIE
jgi:predicted small lipoprotein YifL